MMCDEKANNFEYIEPVVTNQAESGQVHLITPRVMLEESLGQEDLPESQENLHLLKYLVCKVTGGLFEGGGQGAGGQGCVGVAQGGVQAYIRRKRSSVRILFGKDSPDNVSNEAAIATNLVKIGNTSF
jgi:hypothetical protein